MHINSLADKLRKTLPKPLWEITRKITNSILGPLHFSLETGHLRSCLSSRAIDRHGNPLPWFTYSAIQFLLAKDFSDKNILEWGSGQSTYFWMTRAKWLVSVEDSLEWFLKINDSVSNNVVMVRTDTNLGNLPDIVSANSYDVIVCDGLDRSACALLSLDLLNTDGVIIIDNSDGLAKEVMKKYRDEGYSRIDFYGYPPGNTVQQCTSMFFKDSSFILRGDEYPLAQLTYWKY